MKTILLALMMIAWQVEAKEAKTHTVGNGGDVISCHNVEDDTVRKPVTLDVYEAEVMRGIIFDYGTATTVDEMVKVALARLANTFPDLSFELADYYRTWEADALFLREIQLVDINDSEHIALPDGCRVEQIVVQKEPQFPQDKRYTVDMDLWENLDTKNQAALVLHEIVMRAFMKFHHPNSISTRYFNSLISSTSLDGKTQKALIEEVLVELPMNYIKFQGIPIELLPNSSSDVFPTFHKNGNVNVASISDYMFSEEWFETPIGRIYLGLGAFTSTPNVAFYKSGRIHWLRVMKAEIVVQGQMIYFGNDENINFHENGKVQQAFFSYTVDFEDINGQIINCHKFTLFAEDGRVISCNHYQQQ